MRLKSCHRAITLQMDWIPEAPQIGLLCPLIYSQPRHLVLSPAPHLQQCTQYSSCSLSKQYCPKVRPGLKMHASCCFPRQANIVCAFVSWLVEGAYLFNPSRKGIARVSAQAHKGSQLTKAGRQASPACERAEVIYTMSEMPLDRCYLVQAH